MRAPAALDEQLARLFDDGRGRLDEDAVARAEQQVDAVLVDQPAIVGGDVVGLACVVVGEEPHLPPQQTARGVDRTLPQPVGAIVVHPGRPLVAARERERDAHYNLVGRAHSRPPQSGWREHIRGGER